MSESDPETQPEAQHVAVPGRGRCLLPREFAIFSGQVAAVQVCDARTSPRVLLERLAGGDAIVLTGPYVYVDAVFRYCQRFERRLVAGREFAHVADRGERIAAFTAARRRRLHRLLLMAQGERPVDVDDPPDTSGLQEWLEEPTGDETFLIPLRRLQRILTDMRRAREGLEIEGLDGRIIICPHVYVPADRSVPAMFTERRSLIEGKRVLDVGTGTGVLALLAARMGAASVVATDSNPKAVANARLNVERLGLGGVVEARDAADLFEPVPGETFDVILFNAPWMQGRPQTLYDTAIYDPDCRVIDGFLRQAPAHLAPGGVVLLQYSDASRGGQESAVGRLARSIRDSGLRITGAQNISRVSRVLGARQQVFLLEIRRADDL